MKELYPYQQASVDKFVALGGHAGCWNDVGTGKTLVAIETARRLGARGILVVCPLAVSPVWEREVADVLPDAFFIDGTLGTIKERAERLKEFARGDFVATVGYETFWRKPLRGVIERLMPDMIIYDEGHRIKGRGSRQSRFAHAMRKRAAGVLPLTATPMPNGYQDMFSIYKATRPDVFGDRWQDFEDYYIRVTMRPGFPMIIGYKNVDEFERRLHATSTRVPKAEALDLPEEVDVRVPVRMGERTFAVYEHMRKNAIAEIEALDGQQGTAFSSIAMTNLQRLQQITSGFIKVDDGRELEVGTEKLDVMSGLIDDLMPRRVVVFCRFTHDVHAVRARVESHGIPAFELSGRIPEQQRRANIESFRKAERAVLVCQIQVSSQGIDLTASDVAIFYSVDYDLMTYIQARGRLHRHGQVNKVTHYLLIARKSVDLKIYRALSAKEDLSRSALDLSAARSMFVEEPDESFLD